MSYFWQVFRHYRRPLHGLFYMPTRWSIVPFEEIEAYVPKTGLVVDIGCGEGVMAVLLAISSSKRKVIGIDINQHKVRLGQNISKVIPNLSFRHQDALKGNIPKADGFILSDFLHHIPPSKHKVLLKKITESLKNNGIIVLKEIDLKDGLRAKISRFFDFLFYPFQEVNFIHSDQLAKFLTNIGLTVRIIKVNKWFPGSTTLVVCQK